MSRLQERRLFSSHRGEILDASFGDRAVEISWHWQIYRYTRLQIKNKIRR